MLRLGYDDYDREYSRRSDAPKKSWKSSSSKYPSQQRNRGSGFDEDDEFSREITVNRGMLYFNTFKLTVNFE